MILLFFSACRKNDKYKAFDTYVDGYILDGISGDSVAGAFVQLWQDDGGGSTKPKNYDRILATTMTDTTGYYRISFKCDPLKTTAIVAKKSLYFYSDEIDMSMFACGRQGILYTIQPLSWIRVHIKNTLPADGEDSIYFFHNIYFKGLTTDTVFYRQIKTTDVQLDIWDVTKNGTTVRHSAYTGCRPFDTCTLNIFY